MKLFIKLVESTIEREHLFSRDARLLVALSGGPDSVALLRVLLQLGYSCEAAHCNFHLRGEESMRDERFVRQLTNALHVPLHTKDFDTTGYASAHKLSIEMAARELRYDFFEQLRLDDDFTDVVVAHHRDDNVETLLLHLMRGAGQQGLSGMRYRNGHIVRPLLDVSRRMIMDYLEKIGQDYVVDSTNLTPDVTRNKIRLQLLPLMREINPSIDRTLQDTARRMREVSALTDIVMAEGRMRVCRPDEEMELKVDINLLQAEPAPKMLLFSLLYPYGFTPAQIDDVFAGLDGESGACFKTEGMVLLRDRDYLYLKKEEKRNNVDMPCNMKSGVTDVFNDLKLEMSMMTIEELGTIPRMKTCACFDADTLHGALTLRSVRKGDRFIPFGMTGSRLVSDYMTDRKFTLFQKQKQCVLCCGSDIIWLVGERPDNRFTIVEGVTKHVIKVCIK